MASAELKAIFSGDTSGLRSAVSDAEAELARLKKAGGGDLVGELKGGESWSRGLQSMGSVSNIRRDWAGLGEELAGMKAKSQALAAEWPTLREQIGNTVPGVNACSEATRRFAANLQGAKGAAGGMRDQTVSLLGPMLRFATIGMGLKFAGDTIRYASAIKDAADRTGMGVIQFQRLSYAAKMTGTNMEEVENGFRRLQGIVGGDVTKEQEAAFARLGLSLGYLRTLSPDALFQAVAGAMGQIPEPTQRAAIAIDLFGKAGTKLIPMAVSMGALGDEAERFGVVLSENTIKKSEKFADWLDTMKIKAMALGATLIDLPGLFGGQQEEDASKYGKTAYEMTGPGARTAALRRFREARTAEKARQEAARSAELEGGQIRANEIDFIARADAAREARFAAADRLKAAQRLPQTNKTDQYLATLAQSVQYWQKTMEILQQRLPGGA